jgi:hypothetical protein
VIFSFELTATPVCQAATPEQDPVVCVVVGDALDVVLVAVVVV